MKERLLKFLKEKNLSQGKFETIVGLSNGFVNNVGDSIRTKSINKIRDKFPELNIAWLLTGEGEMIFTPVKTDEQKQISDIIELNALTNVIARDLAKLEAKISGRNIDEVFDEFEKDVRSEMRRLVNKQ